MYVRQLPSRYEKINQWYLKIGSLKAVQMVNAKLDEILDEHDLIEATVQQE